MFQGLRYVECGLLLYRYHYPCWLSQPVEGLPKASENNQGQLELACAVVMFSETLCCFTP